MQNFKKKFGLNLINNEALKFKDFLEEFISNGGEFYNATTQDITKSDFLVVAGMLLRYDAPTLSYKINNALVMNKGSGLYFHPIEDAGIAKYSKISFHILTKAEMRSKFIFLTSKIHSR